MNSYLTQEEIDALQTAGLPASQPHFKQPFLIQYVSQGMFSVARFAGGATINGASYTYLTNTDELIRDDVLKWVTRRRKQEKKTK